MASVINREPLLRYCDAQRNLELAIGGVLWAEQQIKGNLWEIKTQIHKPSLRMPLKP